MKKFMDAVRMSNSDVTAKVATAAFLGDSITQGAFELVEGQDGNCRDILDYDHVYHQVFRRNLNYLYPKAKINIINAGIGGATAQTGVQYLQRDVLAYSPDLVVVCYGTNDCGMGMEGLQVYEQNLAAIFSALQEKDVDIIFLTPGTMAEYVSQKTCALIGRETAEGIVKAQNSGVPDLYFERARQVCHRYGIPVCDCRRKWALMKKAGVDTTALLSNGLNHPSREIHRLFANMLVDLLLEFYAI